MDILRKQGYNIGGSGESDTNFVGTRAEWDALSSAEQNAYDTVDLLDDEVEGELPDVSFTATSDMTGDDVLDWMNTNVNLSRLTANTKYVIANNIYTSYSLTAPRGFLIQSGPSGNEYMSFQAGSTKRYYNGTTSLLTYKVLSSGQSIYIYY